MTQRIDRLTIIGLGLLMMPLMTMWHEIGGHAATCLITGGRIRTIGAFYVDCDASGNVAQRLVALAGVTVNAVLMVVAWGLWRRATSDRNRLILWLLWVSQAFVAAGYLCFSGATGVGDLGPGRGGGIGPLPAPAAWRAGELALGIALYAISVRAGIGGLTAMLGGSALTRSARRTIGHGYYAAAGVAAVLVGLLNPVGVFITIMSAAASSFGGLAGFISIGFAVPAAGEPRPFMIERNWLVIGSGIVVLALFAAILGPSVHFR